MDQERTSRCGTVMFLILVPVGRSGNDRLGRLEAGIDVLEELDTR